MSASGQEIESKFFVRDLQAVEKKLIELGAVCKVPRGFEYNLRFDDAQGRLAGTHQVLRLRKSDDVRLTYKGPGETHQGAIVRAELELVVEDFEMARHFLEALGYRAIVSYEKYRAMYALDGALVTLDELPYGTFVEIEVQHIETIAALAPRLGLDMRAAIPSSYIGLFEHVRAGRNLALNNLAFDEFRGLTITAADLGVSPAD